MAKEDELRPYEGGGAGGKLRTSRFGRRSSTPYDRPQTGRHAPANVRAAAAAADNIRSGNTWFSRIVDPASRLITNSAFRLFSSVFKKNPPALTSASDEVEEVEGLQDVREEAVENAKVIEATPAIKERSEPEFTEVEQILKIKTFSREEFNRLTELMESRIVDSSGLKDYKEQSREELHGGVEPSNAVNAEAQRWREERQKAREEKENSVWDKGLFANALTPAVVRNLPDEAGSSPADIAKAFMGVRPYRASSLAIQNRPFRDENTPSKSNGLSIVPRTEGWLIGNGQVEDKFKTPHSARTRSRIQNLSRTPYARNVNQQAPTQRIGDGFPINTPVSQWTPIQSPITGGRQILKRRSSVLDDEFTSGGSIRRTRHKPIFVNQLRSSDPSGSTSNQLIPFLSPRNDGERTALESVKNLTGFERENTFYSREAMTKELCLGQCIPPQSSETARKILEHLDRMVPSPKEISAEAQLAIARDKSPSQLTLSMLNGQARRSTESIDAASLFDKYSPISVVEKDNQLTGQGASSAEQKYGVKGKAPLFSPVGTSVEAPTSSGIRDSSSLIPNAIPAKVDAKLLILDGSTLPEKSKGFRMSALEESDEEGHAGRNAGTVPPFTSDGNGANSIILDGDKQITSSVLKRRAEANAVTSTTFVSIGSPTNNSSGFTFPVTPSNSSFAEPPPTPTVVPYPSDKGSTQPTTGNIIPTYNFGSSSPSKGPIFSFSTSGSTDVDTTKPKFDFKFESKPESSFSSTAVDAAASASTYGFKSSDSIFEGVLTSGLSGSSPSFISSGSIFSTSTTVATTSAGFPSFGDTVSKTNGINSTPFLFPGKSSPAATTAEMDSKSRTPDTIPQVEVSSVIGEDQSFKSSTSAEESTRKSQNEPKASGVSPSPALFGVTNNTLGTLPSTAAASASTSSLFPNTQSAFAASLVGQVSSSTTVTTSAPFAFGSSANLPSLSSSVPSASLFTSSSSIKNTSTCLFGSTTPASASSASDSLFGLSAPSSSSSSGVPSFGLNNSSTSVQFASSIIPASGSGTTLTFGAASNPSIGSSGTSSLTGITGSSTSFGLGSSSQFGSNSSPSFGLTNTPQFSSNTSPSVALSTTSQFGSNTSPSFGLTSSLQSSSSTAPLFGPAVTFGSNTTSSFATGSTPFGSGSTPPFGSGSTPSFGSGSTFGSSSSPSFGGSSSSFGSASAPSFGGSSVSFGAGSTPSFGGNNASYGSASTTPAFGGSNASYGSASTSLFGSSSTPSFAMGQSFAASSATSSQSTLPSFGSGFGGSTTLASAGFSFGGSTAASSGSFTFGGAGSTPGGTTFAFGSPGTTTSTFTFASKDSSSMPQQPMFGLTNSNSAFGAVPTPTPPADQMEDSMAEDPAQISGPALPVFGGQSGSSAPAFMFGSQPAAPSPGQSLFQFSAQPGPAAANPFVPNAPSTFTSAGGGLEFSGGGFSLGAGGEKAGRKFIKAKRDKGRRK